MKYLARKVAELVATLVVCAFLFAMFGGMGAMLAGNHRYRCN